MKDFQSLYQNIDLGIIETSNGIINQSNDYFEAFMKSIMPHYDKSSVLNQKIFQVMKRTN